MVDSNPIVIINLMIGVFVLAAVILVNEYTRGRNGWRAMKTGDTPEEGEVVIARTISECEEYQILKWQCDVWHRQDGGGPCHPFNHVIFWKPFRRMA